MEKRTSNWQSGLVGFGVTVMGLIVGVLLARATGFRAALAFDSSDLWPGVELESLIVPIICFGLGFFARHFFSYRESLREMREEIEDLRLLLREAEKIRSETPVHKGQKIYPILEEFLPDRGDPPVLAKKRKVRVIKLSGEDPAKGGEICVIGLEEALPEVGKNYIVINEQGGVFCSSPVCKISSRYIQTKNSLYEIELINEGWGNTHYQYQMT